MIFRMLRETIGKENFDRLLATFLQTYKGKNASIDDFEKACGQDLAGEPPLLLCASGLKERAFRSLPSTIKSSAHARASFARAAQ
jgi:hypothetical protein